MMKSRFLFLTIAIMAAVNICAQDTNDNKGFVTLTDAVPDAILEIRYFSTYNFVGTRIDGYEEPTALLTRQAADSLRAVSDDVKAMGYRLKIYDAYRPQRGVDHFVRWAENIPDTLDEALFLPRPRQECALQAGLYRREEWPYAWQHRRPDTLRHGYGEGSRHGRNF